MILRGRIQSNPPRQALPRAPNARGGRSPFRALRGRKRMPLMQIAPRKLFAGNSGFVETPSGNCVSPKHHYVSSSGNYVLPKHDYVSPSGNYVLPKHDYVSPSGNDVLSKHHYVSPSGNYVLLKLHYVSASGNYVLPKHDYVSSSGNYVLLKHHPTAAEFARRKTAKGAAVCGVFSPPDSMTARQPTSLPLAGAIALLLTPMVPAGETPDFQREIRPILSNICYKCHGPDPDERKGGKKGSGGLRFDTEEGSRADLDGTHAIVPGHPEKSDLVARITSNDPDDIMPPPKSGKKLTPHEIELLTQWIKNGGNYAKHWSYEKPQRPAVPEIRNPKSEIPSTRSFSRGSKRRSSRHSRKRIATRSYGAWRSTSRGCRRRRRRRTPLQTTSRRMPMHCSWTGCSRRPRTANIGGARGWISRAMRTRRATRMIRRGRSGRIATG